MKTSERVLAAALGLLSLSAKETGKFFEKVSSKASSPKEIKKIFAKLSKEGDVQGKKVEVQLRNAVKRVLKEFDIPTRSELQALERKLKTNRSKK